MIGLDCQEPSSWDWREQVEQRRCAQDQDRPKTGDAADSPPQSNNNKDHGKYETGTVHEMAHWAGGGYLVQHLFPLSSFVKLDQPPYSTLWIGILSFSPFAGLR